MKKLTSLPIVMLVLFFGLTSIVSETSAKSKTKTQKTIEQANKNMVRWFNNGKIDSLVTSYDDNACLLGIGCGKAAIKDFFNAQSGSYKFREITVTSLSVRGDLAVEKGKWKVELTQGAELTGEYLTEWHYTKKKWLIVNDVSTTDAN
jgi:ketosteroid isomerase-like protein